jgi:hypothetical protein
VIPVKAVITWLVALGLKPKIDTLLFPNFIPMTSPNQDKRPLPIIIINISDQFVS